MERLQAEAAKAPEPVKLKLRGGESLTRPVEAYGFPANIPATLKWFRAPAGGQLEELHGMRTRIESGWYFLCESSLPLLCPVDGNLYALSVSDLGARICCQWISDDGMLQSNFAQFGPIQFSLAGAAGALKIINIGIPALFSIGLLNRSVCLFVCRRSAATATTPTATSRRLNN